MKRSEVYLRAAELVAQRTDEPSCLALETVMENLALRDWSKPTIRYQRLFAPNIGLAGGATTWGYEWGIRSVRKDCRILALCFMAAIAEYEEKS